MVEKLKDILISQSFEKINLPKEDSKRKTILFKYNGKIALVNDSYFCKENNHEFMKLEIDIDNNKTYTAQRIEKDGNLQKYVMFYHNLKGLLVVNDSILFKHDF